MLIGLGRTLGTPIPPQYFGMTVLHPDGIGSYGAWPTYGQTPLHDLGYKSYRIWDNDVTWRALEPSKGTFYWDRFDDIMTRLTARGLSVLYTLGQPPVWATGGEADPTHTNSPRYNGNPPTNITDWTDYVGAVATRYAGKIAAYEIWNEFDLANFWTGDEDKMVELGIAASTTIRAIDPTATIVSPSVSNARVAGTPERLARVAQRLSGYIDAVAVHTYNSRTPYRINRDVGIVASFTDLPVWVTEVFNVGATPATDMEAAGQVLKTVLCAWVGGAQRCFWWQMGHPDAPSKLVDPAAPGTILPSGTAYAFMAATLTGASVGGWTEQLPLITVRFRLPDGRRGQIMWADSGTVTVDTSAASSVRDVTGASITRSSGYVLTSTPIYVFA